MRITLISIIISLTSLYISAQTNSYPIEDCIRSKNCSPGIYKDFQEFLQNKPSIRVDSIIVSKQSSELKEQVGTKKMTVYFFQNGKEDVLGRGFWGFNDGEGVYIRSKGQYLELSVNTGYAFYYYEKYSPTGLVYTPTGTSYKLEQNRSSFYYLDFSSGEESIITKKFVKSLLKTNKNLYRQFKKDPSKDVRLLEYIDAFHNNRTHVD